MEKFTKEKDELLIGLVRSNTMLYDASNRQYKNNIFRNKVWENISETLDTPVSDVKKRWKHLRDHYNKKIKADRNSGQTRSQNNWEYMSSLKFLSQVPSLQSKLSNLEANYGMINIKSYETGVTFPHQMTCDPGQNIKNETPLDQNITNDDSTSEGTKERKRKSSTKIMELDKIQEKRAALYAKLSQQDITTPIQKFFESMADVVSQFPPHLAAEARLKVCQVITEIEIKMHSEHTRNMSTPMSSASEDSNNWSWTQM